MPSADSRFDVRYRSYHIKDRNHVYIVPLGDVHFNAPMFAKNHFQAWCNKYKNRDDCLFIGMGDYLETFSTSERKAQRDIHESSSEWQDDRITRDIKDLCKCLSFTKGRWIGMLEGNHAYMTGEGKTTTELLAKELGAEALGVMAAIRCSFRFKAHKSQFKFDIWAHHGAGGGVLAGSTLNSLERFANGFIGDLYIMGHDHGIAHVPIDRMCIDGSIGNIGVSHKTAHLVRSGSFLKAYEPGKQSYIAKHAKRPRHLGTPEVMVEHHRTSCSDYIDAHVTI